MEGMWVQAIGVVATIIASVVTILLKRFFDWVIKKTDAKDAEKEAIQALLEGMAKAQDDFVREAKAASEDGKLTADETAKARELAWEHAKLVATGPGKDLLLTWGKSRAASLIKQLLAKYRSK